MPNIPTEAQREWILAQNFLLRKDKFSSSDTVDEERLKEDQQIFEKVAGKVIDRFNINNLTECYIYEKSYDVEKVIKV